MRFVLALALVACSAPARRVAAPPATPQKPSVVVLFVIDQFPEWAFEQKVPALKGGFARLLGSGEWHIGRHPSSATITAPGHALLGTGQPPATSGILGNEWWDRASEHVVYAVDHDGKSPWLPTELGGLGDATRAVAVSLKARAARLPLGHGGLAIWFDPKTGGWESSGDLGQGPATWVGQLPPVQLSTWTTSATNAEDNRPGEVGAKGMTGATFPHEPKDFNSVLAMPLGNEVILATALAALEHEHPALLVVSLSANDYIGHGWGHESLEAWDEIEKLDEQLAHFLAELDRNYQWAMVVTSDHGAAPMPVQHLRHEKIFEAANNAASAVLGPGTWIAYAHYPSVYLTKAALASKEADNAIKKIVLALRSFPGLARVERKADIAGHCEAREGDDRALCLAIHPERSGEVIFTPAAGWILEDDDEPYATGHGSLNDYDRNVPLIVVPFAKTPHAPETKPRDTVGLETVKERVLELVNKRPRTPVSWNDL
jgi:hypothetical protein